MHIKINGQAIKPEELVKVLEFYNNHKKANDEPLEIQNTLDSGFKINSKKKVPHNNPNNNIRQLRWFKQRLVGFELFEPLTQEEQDLLYKALVDVLGKNMVLWEN